MRERNDRRLDGLGRRKPTDHRNRPAGAVVGVVTNNQDPLNQGRVKLRFPWLNDSLESTWARIAQPYAGGGRGSFWLPEVGDELVVVFDRAAPDNPFVIGGVWNGEDPVPPPGNPDGQNNHKIFRTRNGHQLIFDDTAGGEKITLTDGAGQRHIVVDMSADTITITAEPGDITFSAPSKSINIESKDIAFNASGNSTLTVDGTLKESNGSRSETIHGSDTFNIAGQMQITGASTSVSADSSSLSAQVITCSVAGALSMNNSGGGRTVKAPQIKRTTKAMETVTAPEMEIDAEEAISYTSNGPITMAASASMSLSATDAAFSSSALITLQAGDLKIEGTAAFALQSKLTKLC
ncbi:hypothetical protein KKF91_09880 [Myxococcota bacterium]|nr:hypothetical protein [Myxococcota bacterium]